MDRMLLPHQKPQFLFSLKIKMHPGPSPLWDLLFTQQIFLLLSFFSPMHPNLPTHMNSPPGQSWLWLWSFFGSSSAGSLVFTPLSPASRGSPLH